MVNNAEVGLRGNEPLRLSGKDRLFLKRFFEARKAVQSGDSFTKLKELTPVIDEMEKNGTFQRLQPLMSRILRKTASSPVSLQIDLDVNGEVKPDELRKEDDPEELYPHGLSAEEL